MTPTVQYFIDDGARFVRYTLNGQPFNHAEMEGDLSDRAGKNQFAIKELELTQKYLTEIIALMSDRAPAKVNIDTGDLLIELNHEDTLIQGLFAAATITYGKIFSATEKKGRKKFDVKDFFTGVGNRFRELDKWWMHIRHHYIAHSRDDAYDTARCLFLSSQIIPKFWCFPHVQFKAVPPIEAIQKLEVMVTFMLQLKKTEQQKLFDRLAKSLTPEEMKRYTSAGVHASRCSEWPPSPSIDDASLPDS